MLNFVKTNFHQDSAFSEMIFLYYYNLYFYNLLLNETNRKSFLFILIRSNCQLKILKNKEIVKIRTSFK